MKSRLLISKLTLLVVLLASGALSASGFYDTALGRWLNRDPIQEQGGRNLYSFTRNHAINALDSWGHAMVPCSSATPLPSNSSECDKYGEQDDYLGANLRCFCKCSLDDPWSQFVRGCLRCMADLGASTANAHNHCYSLADARYPGQKPTFALRRCWFCCVQYQQRFINAPIGHL